MTLLHDRLQACSPVADRVLNWPGDRHIPLGRIDFHGRWVDWTAP